ncbi:hypothetical protein LITTLEE_183 [Mycobacterium phage LittleE]|uniref:Uncharacterized protein n=4 Tax=Omegavirus TaxID=1623292 RepID=Q853X9_BPMOM|nr:gp186 [Mycobacterium phage Omega]YP_009012074.1 hypothetical protein CM09_gp175 [Mycobacterium phage Courthouse]YP_009205309.1 hypothetical protein AVT17_gp179 [Mycobacterium phage Ariel]YP_009213398.1 hypothetical protein AVV70_gp181 [Mycobacterium phage MiaZeal]YP_009637094.1 hypothetical protein FGG27_gp183 [Mycobacterium phage LittleE]ASD50871.1 hypothetical protein PORCELAIN_178 [Mycobacterium phage Porcelain]ASD53567.1 hypothetical protein PBI_LUCKY2013_174 [Mycobacterium phage Lucky
MNELTPEMVAQYDQQLAACNECLDKFVETFQTLSWCVGSDLVTMEFANDFVRRVELAENGEDTEDDFGVTTEFLANMLTVAIKRLARV